MAFISKLILLQTGRENDVGGIAVVCQKQKQDVHQLKATARGTSSVDSFAEYNASNLVGMLQHKACVRYRQC